LEGMARQIEVHRGLMDALRNALPEGERARFMIEIGPLKEDVIDAYEALTNPNEPFLRKLRTEKAASMRENRYLGNLVDYRCFVLFSASRSVGVMDSIM